MVSNGLSKAQGALLLSIIALSGAVGRIVSGIIANREWVDNIKNQNTFLILGGVVTIVMPFTTSFPVLIVCAAVFGIGMGML